MIALVNARSIINKSFLLNDIIKSKNLDFMFITETWQRTNEHAPIIELCPPDYSFLSLPRTSGRGGGLAAVFKNMFPCRMVNTGSFSSFELQMIKIGQSDPFYAILVYRPPGPNSCFLTDFSDFLSSILKLSKFILLGDFNIHIDDVSDKFVSDFLSIT